MNECNIIFEKRENLKASWIDSYAQTLKAAYPNARESDILSFLKLKYDSSFKDVKCTFYNNYEKESVDTTLSKMFNFMQKNIPLVSESGTLFKQHAECWNPDSEILQMNLVERKKSKKKMFQYKDQLKKLDKNDLNNAAELKRLSFLTQFYERDQKRRKVIVNSYYGASGLASSRFFNLACATSTTGRGQALISTARGAAEDFLADNVQFMDMDQCIRFIRLTCDESSNRKCKDSDWVENVTVDQVFERLKKKFYRQEDIYEPGIHIFIDRLSQEDLNRVYYKSNFEEFFLKSERAIKIINKIADSEEPFLDSSSPPKDFEEELMSLKQAVLEYVHFCHPIIDRVDRLKFHTRKRVLTIDTDSIFVNAGIWVDFVQDQLLYKTNYIDSRPINNGIYEFRSVYNPDIYEMDRQKIFRIVYTLINIITDMIANTMDDFAHHYNLQDFNHQTAKMKNEFLYEKLLLTDAKKHYQGSVRVQEGILYKEPDFDVKGKHSMPHYKAIYNENLSNCWDSSDEQISSQDDLEQYKLLSNVTTKNYSYTFIYE